MKLAITGSFGYQDIGDEAMLTVYLDFLTGTLGFERKDIFLFSYDPVYTSWYHFHPQENCFSSEMLCRSGSFFSAAKKKIKKTLRFFGTGRHCWDHQFKMLETAAACDALLVTGGGTINTRIERWGKSIGRMHALTSFFHRRGIPVFISGQTVGPLGICNAHDRMARQILQTASILTLRDNSYSRHYIEKLGVMPETCHEVTDDAYNLPYEDAVLPAEVTAFLGAGPVAAVNVTEYTARTAEKHRFMAELCSFIIREKKFRILLTSHAPVDYECLKDIYAQIDSSLQPYLMFPDTRRWRAAQLKKMISKCSLAVGGRYHFIVFAASAGVPFIGMCGNYYSWIKQDGFIRTMECSHGSILNETETWNSELLQSKIMNLRKASLPRPEKLYAGWTSQELFSDWLSAKGWINFPCSPRHNGNRSIVQ